MTDQTAGGNAAPAEDRIVKTADTNVAVPTQPIEEPKAETPEVQKEEVALETGDTGVDDAAEKPKKKGGFQRKLEKLSQDYYQVTAENQKLQDELKTLRTPKNIPENEPKLEQFTTVEDFVSAHRDWAIAQGEKKAQTSFEKAQSERAEQTKLASFKIQEDEVRVKYADYDQSVSQIGNIVQSIPILREYILQNENGAELAYHLAKNPQTFASVLQMTPFNALRELTRIEAKLGQSPPPKTETKAPEPIKPVGASEKAPYNPDKADYMTYKRRMNEQERKRKA